MEVQKGTILSVFFVLCISSHATTSLLMPKSLLTSDVERWAKSFWGFVSSSRQATSQYGRNTGNTCLKSDQYADAIVFEMFMRSFQVLTEVTKLRLPIDQTYQGSQLSKKVNAISAVISSLMTAMENIIQRNSDMTELCNFAYDHSYTNPLALKIHDMYREWRVIKHDFSSFTSGSSTIDQELECGAGHSPNDDLRAVYISLIIAEITAYAAMAFNHNLLYSYKGINSKCIYRPENPDTEMQTAQNNLFIRLNDYNEKFAEIMDSATREFRACDPENFIRDETFFELEGAIQAIVHFPSSVRLPFLGENEPMRCESINNEGILKHYCHNNNKFCITPIVRNCLGRTNNCQTMGELEGCISPEFPRRYIYLKWSEDQASRIVTPYSTYSLAVICFGDDNYFRGPKVVTGVRFIVKNRIMQFQIQQGILDTNFRVRDPKWKPVNDINEEIRAARLKKNLRGSPPGVVENVDFVVIRKGINNAINFDTLELPHPYVLTGVKLKIAHQAEKLPRRLAIALLGHRFDHQTGKLCLGSLGMRTRSSTTHSHEYKYSNRNIYLSPSPTIQKTFDTQYAIIDMSDRMYDGGQTTLPLFDAVPLVSDPPAPLRGMGIFHKSNNDFTGVISLKFLSLDYSKYMRETNNTKCP